MKKIGEFLRHNPRYARYKKPMEAAMTCEAARDYSQGRYRVISYRQGLLTLGVENSSAAADLQMDSQKIIDEVNEKLGRKIVKKLRVKIE